MNSSQPIMVPSGEHSASRRTQSMSQPPTSSNVDGDILKTMTPPGTGKTSSVGQLFKKIFAVYNLLTSVLVTYITYCLFKQISFGRKEISKRQQHGPAYFDKATFLRISDKFQYYFNMGRRTSSSSITRYIDNNKITKKHKVYCEVNTLDKITAVLPIKQKLIYSKMSNFSLLNCLSSQKSNKRRFRINNFYLQLIYCIFRPSRVCNAFNSRKQSKG